MILTRRSVLVGAGAGLLAAATPRPAALAGSGQAVIEMRGNADGSRVDFNPVGLHLQAGVTVRWENRDAGNAHTATAYHPDLMGRPRRIPAAAAPWDTDYLLPGEAFSVTLTEPGVYDFYCVPHEHAGMVGRIVVGTPPPVGWPDYANEPGAAEPLPQIALDGFPAVAEIIALGSVVLR